RSSGRPTPVRRRARSGRCCGGGGVPPCPRRRAGRRGGGGAGAGGRRRGGPKKRGPARRVVDPRDKKLAEQAREISRWQKRAERAEALVALQKQVAALLGTPLAGETSW